MSTILMSIEGLEKYRSVSVLSFFPLMQNVFIFKKNQNIYYLYLLPVICKKTSQRDYFFAILKAGKNSRNSPCVIIM